MVGRGSRIVFLQRQPIIECASSGFEFLEIAENIPAKGPVGIGA